ncbi:acyl-CoA dehydrogenase [Virgisporangium aliadipatigenens]|uniref:Acyl-CoA dehydrogenase n=1 Tax=Virgisporangium aliadipatigenens TaxID=741659 RepID=A0A8J3YJN1_9ACTN|nr:acyl-CoA dehydrogenase family protein [Virgisporangium aliadipatigenens]GIJ45083.1 acyl-CoA dehydrogenase [Virgisporangium aliadipatigenens]
MRRDVYDEEHEAFRDLVRQFIDKEVAPHFAEWERAHQVPRELYKRMGDVGIMGMTVPEEYGGGGVTSFKFNAVLTEESVRQHVMLGTSAVHLDIILPYVLTLATDVQKRRWLPGMAAGELMTAIAMSEPGTGSDLSGIATTARRDGDDWVLSGAKTFITGGILADLVIVVARTSREEDPRAGLTLLVVERDMPGFTRGRNLEKVGLHASDTAELFFDDVRVPAANVLGVEGAAFMYLARNLAQERLSIAVGSQAGAVAALETTIAYTGQRKAWGRPVSSFQNTKFELADCATDVEAGQALLDRALNAHDRGELTQADAAKVKLFCSEVQGRVVDRCVQLHGGYGYMLEYPIAKMWASARPSRIFGGTNEVMKLIISKDLGI